MCVCVCVLVCKYVLVVVCVCRSVVCFMDPDIKQFTAKINVVTDRDTFIRSKVFVLKNKTD